MAGDILFPFSFCWGFCGFNRRGLRCYLFNGQTWFCLTYLSVVPLRNIFPNRDLCWKQESSSAGLEQGCGAKPLRGPSCQSVISHTGLVDITVKPLLTLPFKKIEGNHHNVVKNPAFSSVLKEVGYDWFISHQRPNTSAVISVPVAPEGAVLFKRQNYVIYFVTQCS